MRKKPTRFTFQLGERVTKITGYYRLRGIVVARFLTVKGDIRYVVEHRPDAPGLLHIYGGANLITDEAAKVSRPRKPSLVEAKTATARALAALRKSTLAYAKKKRRRK